ncbi:hypothetical protein GCM10028807_13920 [Spirosoma daeguense]
MKGKTLVWSIFAGICLLVTGISWFHPTHCRSIDSGYYLQSAENILAGLGYSVQENGRFVWNSTFPIGYSLLIATLSGLLGVPVLVGSKLMNLIAIGFSVWRWSNRLDVYRASWLLSVWLLGSFLKIAAYTWSETVFLVLLAEWIWAILQLLHHTSLRSTVLLFGIGCAMFLVRYVGGFVFGLTGLLAILFWIFPLRLQSKMGGINAKLASKWLFLNTFLGVVAMAFYFWHNQTLSGTYFGGERFFPTESGHELSKLFTCSLFNEFLLIRDFTASRNNTLAWIGLLSQAVLFGLFYRTLSLCSATWQRSDRNPLIFLFTLAGVTYLLVLFTLRSVSPFDGPNLRLMAPFTFCLLQAFLFWLGNSPMFVQKKVRVFWLILVLSSWLQLVPQPILLRSIQFVGLISPSTP